MKKYIAEKIEQADIMMIHIRYFAHTNCIGYFLYMMGNDSKSTCIVNHGDIWMSNKPSKEGIIKKFVFAQLDNRLVGDDNCSENQL